MIPIYMIKISENEISEYYSEICKKTWESFGYEIEEFDASTPENLRCDNDLKFTTFKFNDKVFTPTEHAIWYSHYRLWKLCIETDKPLIVIEHDTYLYSKLPDFTNSDIAFFAQTSRDLKKLNAKILDNVILSEKGMYGHSSTISPAAGYYITPSFAKGLLSSAKKTKHVENVDGYLFRYSVKNSEPLNNLNTRKKTLDYFTDWYCCFQYIDPLVGTTILHNTEKYEELSRIS